MIVKVVGSKGTGSFTGLANYLTDERKQHHDKVEDVTFTNCPYSNRLDNIHFIEKAQSINDSESDKTMHIIVSFQEDEKPSKEVLRDIEEQLLKSIGLQDHHRLTVSHVNTNNFHFHIAVNRVDPITLERKDPYRSKIKLQKKALELEEKLQLKKDNHIPNWILAEQNRKSNDLNQEQEKQYEPIREQHSGAENRRLRVSQSVTNDLKNRTKTEQRDSMRKLSDINMVHNKKLTKMLLPTDERNSVRGEEQGIADNQLRWERQSNSSNVGSSGVANDIKSHTGITNLTDWIRDNALVDIKAVLSDKNSSLEHLHTTLAKYNLELKERGNGLIIKDKTRNLFCKASDIDRNLSKNNLAKLYGSFTAIDIDIKPTIQFGTPKNDYWDRYKAKMDLQYKTKKEKLDIIKNDYNENKDIIKDKWKQRVEYIKSSNFNKKLKKESYQKIFANQKKELDELYRGYSKQRAEQTNQNKQITYKDYLIGEALKGDNKALEILRKQKPPKPKEDDNTVGGREDHKIFASLKPLITKLGFVVYKLTQKDNSKIIDKGNHIKVSNADDNTVLKALEMAKIKYGSTLDITGNDAFKTKVISLVQKHNLDIKFKDKNMQETLEAVNTKSSSVQKEEEKQVKR
ncbi:MAG: relaxase/mobilization nuclease domain-containing protein [Sulfurovum sp.]|nr:relaxase/mobilization nuclease domain-containing protein [Sulfurovum sp.]